MGTTGKSPQGAECPIYRELPFWVQDVLINEALRNVIDQLKSAFEYSKTGKPDEKANIYLWRHSFIGIVVE